MEYINRLFITRAITLTIKNYTDPDDGTRSMDAVITDNYTGEVLFKDEWRYDFRKMLNDLNEKIKEDIGEIY